jgi:uncharacterized membrane protein
MLTWTAPQALWLLLAVPLVWLAHLVARTNFSPRQRWLQAGVRSLLLVALALALARPVVSGRSSRQSIVYVVDVSHSVSGHAIEAAALKIDELNRAMRPAHWRIVAFGGTAAAVDDTTALRKLAQVDARAAAPDPVDRSATDLEAGLDAGRSELAPGHVPRLVLFSDGRPTAGDEAAAMARLAADRIPVSIEPLGARSLGDTWVDTLDLPDRIAAKAPFTATIGIGSQRDGSAIVELRSGTQVLARRTVPFSKGTTAVALDAAVEEVGPHVLQAAVTVPHDPLSANNTIDRAVWADPRAKVLYVEGVPASARYLSGALTQSGFDVTVRPPSRLPATTADFDPWDAVVLSDVGHAAIPAAAVAALSRWVEQGGGGLLVAGGEPVFGEGGYRKTPIERLTPVTFERKDQPEVALILVLDRSSSMAGASIDLCKAAARAAVDVMTDEQSIGILTFNDKFDWGVTLRNVGRNRDVIRQRIAAIEPGGHTLIYPAVEQAYLALRSVKARAKHVVLLSDGRSYPADYEALVQKMVASRITVSSVAVGPWADPELLRNIAKWGKGRAYVVADAKELPQIFVEEARSAMTPAFDEKEITAIVKAPAFLSGVDLAHLPRLRGRTATVLKDTALEVIGTDDDDPLLAFWPIGLGRTAVFTSDVKDRWAANWVTWRGYGPFFASVVRAIARQRPPAAALDVAPGPIHRHDRSIVIGLEARDPGGGYRDLLHPAVQARSGNGSSFDVQLRQVAPGRYEATVVADAAQPLTVTTAGADAGVTSRVILPDAAAEYRFRPPDEALLKSIASATGGVWKPTPATLAAAGDNRTQRRPFWPALVATALCLWFVDLAVRRVRLFEPHVDS